MQTSMKFSISYKLHEAGWATVNISNGVENIEYPVSYLHDSLRELVQLAISVKNSSPESRVVFMDEPGEIHLVVKKTEALLSYEVRQFRDWASWGMYPENDYEVILEGNTKPERITHQVVNIVDKIEEEIGIQKYKELWVEHEFPTEKIAELKNA